MTDHVEIFKGSHIVTQDGKTFWLREFKKLYWDGLTAKGKLHGGEVVTRSGFDCRLGSGVLDKSGQEIFEGDFVRFEGATYKVTFRDAAFWVGKNLMFNYTDGELEIVPAPKEIDDVED